MPEQLPEPSFKDHFSNQAEQYAQHRPSYPPALIDWISAQATQQELAWDAATGNGQAAVALATHFARVYATDASAEQIQRAESHPRVVYACEPAEACELPTKSVDLVTVAQAAHWFDHDRFNAEIMRVAKPGATVAIWCYELCRVDPQLDPIHLDYYQSLDPYWPAERALIENGYRTIPFPFEEICDPPRFELTCDWQADEFLGYLSSWSATQRCKAATAADPLQPVADILRRQWGEQRRQVSWPITLRVGRV